MLTTIIFLILLGLGMVFVEFFLPGGILGVIGAVLLIVAVALGYSGLGVATGNFMLLGLIVFALILIPLWFKMLDKSPLGRKMVLKTTNSELAPSTISSLQLGMIGRTLSTMRPYGTIRIGELKFEAMSEAGLIEAGTEIEITRVEADRVQVRSIESDR